MGISRVPGLSTQASALLSDPGRATQTLACLASLLGLTSACAMLPPLIANRKAPTMIKVSGLYNTSRSAHTRKPYFRS